MRKGNIDAVLNAAATAFGFVYIHPYQDGNGRLHPCLIQACLSGQKIHAAKYDLSGLLGDAR